MGAAAILWVAVAWNGPAESYPTVNRLLHEYIVECKDLCVYMYVYMGSTTYMYINRTSHSVEVLCLSICTCIDSDFA